jgi:hypothetical protein
MNKRLILAVAAIVVMSVAPQAHSIEGFVSYWNGKDTDNGYGLGVGQQIKIVPIVSGGVRLSWLSFGDSDLNLYPLEALVRAKFGMFYGGGGIGYYIFDGKNVDFDNSAGGFLIAGVDFTLAKIGAFGELKYTFVNSKVAGQDVDGSGIGVNVGVVFNWF